MQSYFLVQKYDHVDLRKWNKKFGKENKKYLLSISVSFGRDFIGDASKINLEFGNWPILEVEPECWSDRIDPVGLLLRVTGDKPNGFTAVSIANRTAGGLIELARSELDEAILAWRKRSIDKRRSDKRKRRLTDDILNKIYSYTIIRTASWTTN